MYKKIIYTISLFVIYVVANGQINSSRILTQRISGGGTKRWYTRPEIIDNPRQVHYSTLTFKLKTKTGNLSKSGGGRDISASFRDFNNWSIEKHDDNYILIISKREKYFVCFLNADNGELILMLDDFPDNRNGELSLGGRFFEKPIQLN